MTTFSYLFLSTGIMLLVCMAQISLYCHIPSPQSSKQQMGSISHVCCTLKTVAAQTPALHFTVLCMVEGYKKSQQIVEIQPHFKLIPGRIRVTTGSQYQAGIA